MTKYTVVFPDKKERVLHDDVLPRIGDEITIYQSGPHTVARVSHTYNPSGDIVERQVFVGEEASDD